MAQSPERFIGLPIWIGTRRARVALIGITLAAGRTIELKTPISRFDRRERAMHRFRKLRSLCNFTTVHFSLYNHFNLERPLYRRAAFKRRRFAALREWRQLGTP